MVGTGESSKKGKKRSIRQENAIIAATTEDRPGIRISEKGSNSIHNDSANAQEVVQDTQGTKKKTRGPAKLKFVEKGKEIELEQNIRGQPIGVASSQFSSHIGSLARELVPVSLDSWKNLSDEMKEKLWTCVNQKYLIDDYYKADTIKSMGALWRDFKSRLSTKVRNLVEKGDATRHLALIKPDNLKAYEWDLFVKKRCSAEFKATSTKFKKMRAKQTLLHTTSRKGYARLEDEMKKESPTPSAVSRVDVWIRGHKKKNGEPINEAARETMKKMEEYNAQASIDPATCSLKDDAIAHVLGPERRGRVRGLGFGATPSKVNAQLQQGGRVQKLEAMVLSLAEEVKNIKSEQRMRKEGCSGGDDNMMHTHISTPQSQHASANVQDGVNLDNTNCKLLHWAGTGEIVAEGTIASTTPTSLVHHVPLGPDSWKVWVNDVTVPNVPLFRPTREFFILDEAVGSTIAWPIRFISLDV